MPRPNKEWEKKYGTHSKTPAKKTLLTMADDVLSATRKLAQGYPEAQAILLQMVRKLPEIDQVMRLLDADDMGLHGYKIVKAYHGWAGNDYEKLAKGLKDRSIPPQ